MLEHPEFMPLLRVASGSMRGASFRLGAAVQVIGRDTTADIVLEDPHLSRRHAAVRVTEAGVSLMDLGSTNGTWLNDVRIDGAQLLSDGDMIRLGWTDLRFLDPGMAITEPVGLSFGTPRRDHRPTLPLPIANPPEVVLAAAGGAEPETGQRGR